MKGSASYNCNGMKILLKNALIKVVIGALITPRR